jgi:hypothetical protein
MNVTTAPKVMEVEIKKVMEVMKLGQWQEYCDISFWLTTFQDVSQ